MNPQHYSSYNAQPLQPHQQFYGHTGSAALGGQFATAGRTASMSGGGVMPPPLNVWTPPSPQEHQYYDILFSHADEEKRNAIGGRIAVAFFSRSGVDKMHLREIWTIADSQQRSELSRNEFYVAMRLISMAQRGEVVSAQRFYELAATPFPLPAIEGVASPTQQFQPHPQHPQHPQHQPQPPPAAAPSQGGTYAITDDEKQRYDGIFQQYDTDHDGFLHGGEAVQLFGMSGLDRGVLREIWSLADRGQDSRLDVKEFYIAMHMIVCVSKRGLPLPKELPTEMAESVYGTRTSFTSTSAAPLASLGSSSSSRSNSMTNTMAPPTAAAPAPAPATVPQESTGDPMDAFAGLSPVVDSVSSSIRVSSFGRTNSGSSQMSGHASSPPLATPSPSSAPSFPSSSSLDTAMASLSVGTAHGNGGMELHNSAALHGSASSQFGMGALNMSEPARDRAASIGSVSSFTSVSTEASNISHHTTGGGGFAPHTAPQSAAGGGGFHGLGAAQTPQMHPLSTSTLPATYTSMGGGGTMPAPQAAAPKPFLSDESEAAAVLQLDQSNGGLAHALQSVEKKQHAAELLSEKLRELDQLRHELVTLSLKRESVRAAAATSSSPQPPVTNTNAVDAEAMRAVEQNLRALIDGEKTTIQALQTDISQYERQLQQSGGAIAPIIGFGSLSATPGPEAPLSMPVPSASIADVPPKSTFETFGGFDSASSPAADAFAASFNFN